MSSGASVELVLLAPGLLGPEGAGSADPGAAHALVDGLDLEGLDRLLARAGHAAAPEADDSLEALAFRSFGHAAPSAGTDWPVAAFTRQLQKKSLEVPVQPDIHAVSGPMWRVAQVHCL